jgi:hypothetical protein
VAGYHSHRALLRALWLYACTHPDASFRRRAEELNRQTLPHISRLFMIHRDHILHPEPEKAIYFGLLMVALTLHGLIISDDEFPRSLAPTGEKLAAELTRMFLGYIGAEVDEDTVPAGFFKAMGSPTAAPTVVVVNRYDVAGSLDAAFNRAECERSVDQAVSSTPELPPGDRPKRIGRRRRR